jgi:hypothetical protein
MSVLLKREEIFSISDFGVFLNLSDLIFKSLSQISKERPNL